MIYSYYAFVYKIAALGLNTFDSIMFFESNWAFYAGYGMPFTIFLALFPGILSYALYGLMFPTLVAMSVSSDPI